MSNNLGSAIRSLSRQIAEATIIIGKLGTIIFLGVLLLLLKLIPCLIRLSCIAIWVFGIWWCYSSLYALYLPGVIDAIQALALVASVTCLLMFIPILAVQDGKNVWSGLLGSGLLGIFISAMARFADSENLLIIALLGPIILLGFLLFYILIRFKETEVPNE